MIPVKSCSELKDAYTAADVDGNGALSLDEALAFTGRFGCATQLKHDAPVVPVRAFAVTRLGQVHCSGAACPALAWPLPS